MEIEPPLDALLESEWSRSRSQKRRRRSGRAARLAASVVAHTDQAGEFAAYGLH